MDFLIVHVEFFCADVEREQVQSAFDAAGILVRELSGPQGSVSLDGLYIRIVGTNEQLPDSPLTADLVICFDQRQAAGHSGDTICWPGSVSALTREISQWYYKPPAPLPIELNMAGSGPAFTQLVDVLKQISKFDAPVLIKGETGTGKEVAARAVHYLGERQNGPFVPVNCGAYNDDLFIAELFGYERGAFTDAKQRRAGLVQQAARGTLFLDELDSLSPKAQVMLLRFLQDQEYRPLGAEKTLKADVRIIAATNQPIEKLISERLFREDLFYRLDILGVDIPPLRERVEDISILAGYFLDRLARNYAQPVKYLSADTMAWMEAYAWPGNIRELENYLHKLHVLSPGRTIHAPQVKGLPQQVVTEQAIPVITVQPDDPHQDETAADVEIASFNDEKNQAIADFEQNYLDRVLTRCQGNLSQAARLAGKERRSFARLVEKYGIEREQYSC